LVHSISLGAVLFVVWLLLSGHYEPLVISFGVVSCALVVVISTRMDVADREGQPIHLTWNALVYWPWLMWQIVLANIDVARRVLSPALPVSPTLIRVKVSQKSDLGKVIYANSITLTPGTISMDVTGDEILVHALTREAAQSLEEGEMDRRVTIMAGEAET
jgi:multicomponent Na+:H+ antiporter subunit E